MAQLAAIDQTALQSGSLSGARAVITAWALPGGPTTTTETSPWELRALRGAPEASGPATLLGRLADHYPDSASGRPVTPALRSL